jgi:hypothetical protein
MLSKDYKHIYIKDAAANSLSLIYYYFSKTRQVARHSQGCEMGNAMVFGERRHQRNPSRTSLCMFSANDAGGSAATALITSMSQNKPHQQVSGCSSGA